MADDITIEGRTYKLRAGAPMPIGDGEFILHTFMAEENEITTYLYTEDLPSSTDMRGQNGELTSASFNKLESKDTDAFSGRKVKPAVPPFIEEEDIT